MSEERTFAAVRSRWYDDKHSEDDIGFLLDCCEIAMFRCRNILHLCRESSEMKDEATKILETLGDLP